MKELDCCLVKDLLPLYIDNVLSPQSKQLVQEHLEQCESCRAEYESLRQPIQLPTAPDVQEENTQVLKNFKKKWTKKKIVIALLSGLLAVFLFFPIRNAVVQSELFSPVTSSQAGTVGQLHLGDLSDGKNWTQLKMIHQNLFDNSTSYNGKYLNFDNIFYEKKVINHGFSSTAVQMRVLDADGNIVKEPFWVQPGKSVSLEELHYFTPYIVEYRASGDFYQFAFI